MAIFEKISRGTFLLFGLLLLLSSCSEDFFEEVIDIKIPDHTPRLSIAAYLLAGDSIINVYVSHSLGFLDTTKRTTIKNAVVQVFKNGATLAIVPYSSKQFYKLKLPKSKVIDQAFYELKISAPGYPPITSQQKLPAPVPILGARFEKNGAIDSNGEKFDLIVIEFQDNAIVKNYYAISGTLEISPGDKIPVSFNSLDPLSENAGEEVLVKDDSFNGKKFSWRLGSHLQFPGAKLILQLESITKDKYLFLKSIHLYEEAEDNPFAEPVLIHSNIEGGFGIFSAESRTYFTLTI
jgi:hypothetical protein